MVALADGTIDVIEASRNGTALTPTFIGQTHYFGYEQATIGARKTVAPGASASFDLTGIPTPGQGNESMALPAAKPTPEGDSLVAMWPIAEEGTYSLSVSYTLAPVAGADPTACAGTTTPVKVSFTVGTSESPEFRWMWVIIGAGAVLVLTLLVFVLMRKGKRRTTTLAVLAMMVAGGLATTQPQEAAAELTEESIVHTPYPMWVDKPDGPCLTTPINVEPNKRYQLVVWSAEAKTLDYAFRLVGT